MEKADRVRILVAELERCLAACTGALSEAELDEQIAAQRDLLRLSNSNELARLGLAMLRAMNARLRRELELRNPRRLRLVRPGTLH